MEVEDGSSSDSTPDWYTELDEQQKEAAEHRGSYSVLFAGPGTGKTRAPKGKALAHIKKYDIEPELILAFSFTRVVARQLRICLAWSSCSTTSVK